MKDAGMTPETSGNMRLNQDKVDKTHLFCTLLNARSLNYIHKRNELELLVCNYNFDIIAVTETWLTDSMSGSEVNIDGYTLFRRDRSTIKSQKGGGVLLYVKECFCAFEHEKLNKLKCEAIWVKLQISQQSTVTVGVCYRSQMAEDHEICELFTAIQSASSENAIILGDFNYPGIDWATLECESSAQAFLDLVHSCFLHQHVMESTRQSNILDLVFTTEVNMVENLRILEPLSTSDHNVVVFDFITKTEVRDYNSTRFCIHKANFESIRKYLSKINWTELLGTKDATDKWLTFKKVLDDVMKRFVPVARSKRKSRCMWLNFETRKAIKARNRNWKKYILTKQYGDYIKYKQSRNKTVKAIRRAKNKFEKKLVSNVRKDAKSFYAYVRSRSNTKEKVGPLRDENGKLINDDEEIAGVLNSFFSSVFTDEGNAILPEVTNRFKGDKSQELGNINISEETVLNKIKHLKEGKAPGDDGFAPLFLKEIANEIYNPLSIIFRSSLEEGKVPEDWKIANVTPIFKKGSRQAPENYRPISLTSQVGKILESIIKDSLLQHLKSHKLINDSQHGFTSKRSCLTNLLSFLELVTDYIDQGLPVDVIYLDFQKAFDKVPHGRLLSKVRAHGINDKIAGWIQNWLSERQQRVVLNGNKSEWCTV
jgi:hypothetical protein